VWLFEKEKTEEMGVRPIKLVVFVFLVRRLTMTETDWTVGRLELVRQGGGVAGGKEKWLGGSEGWDGRE